MRITKKFLTIPATIEDVVSLLTARGWEKSAIVYAWTQPEESGGRPKKSAGNPALYNLSEFAALGITGLRDRNDVAWYRRQWVWAVENGWVDPIGPGDEIDMTLLYEEKFPPHPRSYKPSRKAIETAIEEDPSLVEEVYQRAPAVRKAVNKARERRIHDLASKTRQRPIVDKGTPVTPIDDAVEQMDGVIDEAGRRDALHELQRLAAQIREKADQWAETWGYTGVEEEVEWVHEIGANLTEAQWRVLSFAVDQEEDAR